MCFKMSLKTKTCKSKKAQPFTLKCYPGATVFVFFKDVSGNI